MENHIFIYNEIGMWGNDSEDIRSQLAKMPDADKVVVHISSPGGEVFEGWTIGNILKSLDKEVEVIIEGLCASIATYIALQADTIKMSETARFMIHNPKIPFMESIEEGDLDRAKEMLGSIKNDLVKTYRKKTGLSDDELSEMMDGETWLTSQEAMEKGFIDEVITGVQAVAKFKIDNINTMKKSEDKSKETAEKSKLDKIADGISTLLDNMAEGFSKAKNDVPAIQNMAVELEDGTMIFVESEDGELEGKFAFIADEEGNKTEEKAPEGTHMLNDGRSITVDAEGMITSVQEVESDDMAVEDLKNEIERLKSELEAKNKASEELTNELSEYKEKITSQDEKLNSQEEQIKGIASQLEEIKNLTAGGDQVVVKANNKPSNKSQEPAPPSSGLGSWGKSTFIK